MQLGLRKRGYSPPKYKGYRIVRTHGRYFAVPAFLNAAELETRRALRSHPAVLQAATRQRLEALIDCHGNDSAGTRREVLERCEGYDLVRHRGSWYAIPGAAAAVDLDIEEERRQAGVLCGATVEALTERIHSLRGAVPVEFAGWLPIFESMGNCGKHPQFTHTSMPPPGYRFTRSAPPAPNDVPRQRVGLSRLRDTVGWGAARIWAVVVAFAILLRPLYVAFRPGPRVSLRNRLRLVGSIVRLVWTLWRGGGSFRHICRFIRSRHFASQLLLAEPRPLVFLTSAPYTLNQNPWVLEIEDPTTLFFPFVQNGGTCDLEIHKSPYFPIVKTLLETARCRAIVTHMKSTARLVPALFRSATMVRKVHYVPLGVKLPDRWQRHEEDDPEVIHLLFINSWSQTPGNLQVRGGLDVLEAFDILRERYPQLRLTMRTNLMPLDEHYHRIIESGWVRVIDRFLTTEEMEALHAESHVFLLPAARVHIVSLLQAMASGLAVVASDGWGFEEYLCHERNGLVVKGRYGKTSWADEDAGMLREDYESTFSPDPEVVQGIVEAVSRLVEDHELRRRLGRAARHEVETSYNLERWNEGLKQVFDKALLPD